MSELRINNITDRAGSSGPIIAGVSTVTSTSHMVMPSGPTVFTNSTIPSWALWRKKNKIQGIFVHFGVAKSLNLGLFA